jgi:hypothetical protein
MNALPFNPSMAASPSVFDAISTNANPRERPLNLSATILTDVTSPNGENASLRSCSVVSYGRLPT